MLSPADRRPFGDHHALVLQRRHLALWIDREIVGLELIAFAELEQVVAERDGAA
jgi:hypothetical protein